MAANVTEYNHTYHRPPVSLSLILRGSSEGEQRVVFRFNARLTEDLPGSGVGY